MKTDLRQRKGWRKPAHVLVVVGLLIVTLYLSFAIGFLAGRGDWPSGLSWLRFLSSQPVKQVDFSLYWEAWSKLKSKSIKVPGESEAIQGAIGGMVNSLGDPYTVYFDLEDTKRFREDISGEFSGIGVEIVSKSGFPTVVKPLPDSPAEKAGIKERDIISEVDGKRTDEIGFDQTINLIRGKEGTEVKIRIVREGAEAVLDFAVRRSKITVNSVALENISRNNRRYMHIKVQQFGDDTDRLFTEIASQASNNKPDGIILDLRNNSGGYVETAVNMASFFIDGGTVVSEKGKNSRTQEYKTTQRSQLNQINTVVLVNGWSASASEIIAGAMQDRGAGKIIGEKTFGKGSVQEIVPLSDGSSIKVTVADWFTPKGRQITDKGILPDIEVKDDEKTATDEQLDRAILYLTNGQ